MKRIIHFSFALVFFIISCTSNINKDKGQTNSTNKTVDVSYINQQDKQGIDLMLKGTKIIKLSTNTLSKALKSAIDSNGAESAIDFCKIEAMKITDSLSIAEGVTIRRIATKYRNPDNETNPVELKIFEQYVTQYLSGTVLKSKLAINKNGHPVFYKPILIKKKCLTCHGKPGDTMPQNIAEKIAKLYPNDNAINFEEGYPRGMWAITFTDITIDKK